MFACVHSDARVWLEEMRKLAGSSHFFLFLICKFLKDGSGVFLKYRFLRSKRSLQAASVRLAFW